jgi:hypothetical protein
MGGTNLVQMHLVQTTSHWRVTFVFLKIPTMQFYLGGRTFNQNHSSVFGKIGSFVARVTSLYFCS